MAFILGDKSQRELVGVHPILVDVTERAIELTRQDFTVYDGLRTAAEQELLIRRGASQTRDSYHMKQVDGFGHAVDLVPIISGVPKWDWNGCYLIALAVDQAATEQGVAHLITWGAIWDRTLDKYGGDAIEYKKAVDAYCARHPGKDFIDGPHYQLAR